MLKAIFFLLTGLISTQVLATPEVIKRACGLVFAQTKAEFRTANFFNIERKNLSQNLLKAVWKDLGREFVLVNWWSKAPNR